MKSDLPSPVLSYADAPTGRGHRVAAAAALMLGGLGLMFIGGCFMIGIVMILRTNTIMHFKENPLGGPYAFPSTVSGIMLLMVLTAMAFGSFGSGIWLIVSCARELIQMLRKG